jgi:tryptophan-rich sensory protein
MITQTQWLFWAVALAYAFIPIHTQRMPVYWERELQSYMPMYIPKQVFFPVWMITYFARGGFGALFFQNTVFDDFYEAIVILWLSVSGLLLIWNWCFFTPVTFYAAGPVATLWFGCELATLILTVLYGDTRPWVIGFICIALAWSLVAMVIGWVVTVRLGAKFSLMKDSVAKLTEQTIDNARAFEPEYTTPAPVSMSSPVRPRIAHEGLRLTQMFG